MLSRAKNIA